MPGFTVTRGFGPGATPSNLIARGFLPVLALEVISIIRGASRAKKKIYEETWEMFKISAALIAHNGSFKTRPLVENIRKTFTPSKIDIKSVSAKTVEHKKSKDIDVKANIVKVRNKNVKY
tara:strand:+ start:210 stop:569 length:360 start_codon:yes stop_codon:yes gene_type:complete